MATAVTVGVLSVDLRARTAKFIASMAKARATVNKFVAKTLIANTGLSKLGTIASGAALIGVGLLIDQQRKAIDRMGKMSDEMNITTEDLSGFRLAAELTGTSIEVLNKGFQRMIRRLGEVSLGFGEGVKVADKLGISMEELVKLDAAEQMRKVSTAIRALPSAAQRAAVAFALFGRQGQELMNFLLLGGEGMDEIKQKAIDIGLAFDRVAAKKVEIMNDALTIASNTIRGFINQITIKLAPAITVISREFEKWATESGGVEAKVSKLVGVLDQLLQVLINIQNVVNIPVQAVKGLSSAVIAGFGEAQNLFLEFSGLKQGTKPGGFLQFFGITEEDIKHDMDITKLFKDSMVEAGKSLVDSATDIAEQRTITNLRNKLSKISQDIAKEAKKTLEEEEARRGSGQQQSGIDAFRSSREEARKRREREVESLLKARESTDPDVARAASVELKKIAGSNSMILEELKKLNNTERNKVTNRNSGSTPLRRDKVMK